MTKRVTRVSFSEIRRIRMTCESCGTTVEFSVGGKAFPGDDCPACRKEILSADGSKNVLLNIDNIFRGTKALKNVSFEFEVEEKEP